MKPLPFKITKLHSELHESPEATRTAVDKSVGVYQFIDWLELSQSANGGAPSHASAMRIPGAIVYFCAGSAWSKYFTRMSRVSLSISQRCPAFVDCAPSQLPCRDASEKSLILWTIESLSVPSAM